MSRAPLSLSFLAVLLSSCPSNTGDLPPPATLKRCEVVGRATLIYGLGRISSIKKVEVLADGRAGGPAVVASTSIPSTT